MAGFSLSEALAAVMDGGGPILGAEDAPDPIGLCDAGHGEEPELDGAFWGFDAGIYPLAITDSLEVRRSPSPRRAWRPQQRNGGAS